MKWIVPTLIAFTTLPCFGQKTYGEEFEIKNPTRLIAELGDSGEMQLQGEIESTCQMKGCWMNIVLADGERVRVTFKDYGFFVPKSGVESKKTVMNGVLEKQVTSVESLRHFARDAGKSEEEVLAITQPQEEYSFVAEGVIIF